MWTTTPPARRLPLATVHGVPAPPGSTATAEPEDLPTVRDLGQALAAVILQRARQHAGSWRRGVHTVATAGAYGWRCVAQVVLIVLASASLAWLVWDSTAGQRRTDAPAELTVPEAELEGSLVDTDVTRDLVRRRVGESRQAGGTSESVPAGKSSSPVGGWVLSVVGLSAVLTAGGGAAVVVIRRHRLRTRPQPEQPLRPVHDDLPELFPADEPAADEAAGALATADDAGGGTDEPVGIDLEGGTTDGLPAAPSSPLLDAGPAGATPPLWTDLAPAPARGAAARSTLLLEDDPGQRIETKQRLFERRSAPRVDYVQPGTMSWRGASWPLSVRDLSGTGMRLLVADPKGSRLPAAREHVQVDFPVDGGSVHVGAQVAWRRTTPDGTELGLVFRALAADDDERISRTCLARC